MNIYALFFTLALAVAVHPSQSHKTPADWPISSYLYRPPEARHVRPALDWTRQQVAELGHRNITSPDQIRDFFEQSLHGLPRDGSVESYLMNSNLKTLVQLADVYEPTCSARLVEDYIEMAHYFYGSLEALARPVEPETDALLNYLQHFGRAKFRNCPHDVEPDYQLGYPQYDYGQTVATLDPDTEWAFDQIIGSQDKVRAPGGNPSERLARVASQVDLVKGKFEAKRMLHEAQQYPGLLFAQTNHLTPEELLAEALWTCCMRLLNAFQSKLDAYNLNRLLSPPLPPVEDEDSQEEEPQVVERPPPARFVKLNEYGRLCQQVRGSNTREQVKKVIKKQLRPSRWG